MYSTYVNTYLLFIAHCINTLLSVAVLSIKTSLCSSLKGPYNYPNDTYYFTPRYLCLNIPLQIYYVIKIPYLILCTHIYHKISF